MRVTTKLVMSWDGKVLEHNWYEYDGPVALACGATSAQTQLQNEQMSAYQTLQGYAQQEFGDASALFKDFQTDFAPIMNAGPNQFGESPAELAAINSNIVTTEGQAGRNAIQAANAGINAEGSGNEFVPQGQNAAIRAGINTSTEQATANAQQQNIVQGYNLGRQNWLTAAQELGGATQMFNPATSGSGAATGSGEAAGTTANQISQANMAPWSTLASVAGAGLGALATYEKQP